MSLSSLKDQKASSDKKENRNISNELRLLALLPANMLMAEDKREIKLYCPSTAELIPYMASNSDRIDLGGIANVFGLEPATLKINGHFIGRGPDLIASSVTWKALISFFLERGFPTGAVERSPLIVHGKILKPGNKRTHEPTDDEKLHYCKNNSATADSSGRMHNAGVCLSKKRKLANTVSHIDDRASKPCHKRKHFLLENLSLRKKLKIVETESSKLYEGQSSAAQSICQAIEDSCSI
ncbi:unnamed protein product [Rhodiola kirilowii]